MRVIVRYHGRVQGVGFRATVRSLARHLPVTGFVRNEPDGSVHMEAQGEAAAVERLKQEIRLHMSRYIQSEQESPAADMDDEAEFRIAR